ncbi:Protein_PAT1-like 1 [Hexamita inflata]|uniref:Protein PAT1-like 1 n=1 Tax=Hexamita inflata TaxID=28002 RepID=A0AA86U7B8_9EUKA|nr:Protein PAT1-like 1 [Hexamita inflata]
MSDLDITQQRVISIMYTCTGVLSQEQENIIKQNGKKEVTINEIHQLVKQKYPDHTNKRKNLVFESLKRMHFSLKKREQQYHVTHVYLNKDIDKILDQLNDQDRVFQAEQLLKQYEISQKMKNIALQECNNIFKRNDQLIVFDKEAVIHEDDYNVINETTEHPQQMQYQQMEPQQMQYQQRTPQQMQYQQRTPQQMQYQQRTPQQMQYQQMEPQQMQYQQMEPQQMQYQQMEPQQMQYPQMEQIQDLQSIFADDIQQYQQELQQHKQTMPIPLPQQYEGQILESNSKGQTFFKSAALNQPYPNPLVV